MRKSTQTNGRQPVPVPTDRNRLVRLSVLLPCALLLVALFPRSGAAQTLRLGVTDWFLQAKTDVGYDSNVDGVYPEEEDPDRKTSDFYWMPGLTLKSAPWVMAPRTTFDVLAGVSYQDYFNRNDLDTELYNAQLTFQTANPRLTLGGMAGTEYDLSSSADEYKPGGVSRDPTLTQQANVFANLLYRALRVETRVDYTQERHDYEEYWDGDNDETVLFAGATLNPLTKLALMGSWENTTTLYPLSNEEEEETVYTADVALNLFSWGGFYYTWERTITIEKLTDATTEDTISTFGMRGSLPLELLRHPQITYSLGFAYEEEENEETGVVDKTWEPVHTLTASDDLQISRSLHLRGSATWDSKVADDEISFVYNAALEHQLAPKVQHALTLTREPKPTFGSTSDTDTTTYGYNFNWGDFVFQNLTLRFTATYEESTPLEEKAPETEKTTTYSFGLNHTRPLSRKLNRIIAYTYTSEESNFHEFGPNERHLATYGFTYDF